MASSVPSVPTEWASVSELMDKMLSDMNDERKSHASSVSTVQNAPFTSIPSTPVRPQSTGSQIFGEATTLHARTRSIDLSEADLTNCIKDLRSILQRGDLRLPPSPHAAARSERARREEEEELSAACASNCWLSLLEPAEQRELLDASERVPFAAQDLLLDSREHRRGALFLVLCGGVSLIAQDPPAASAGGASPRERLCAVAAGDLFSARDIGRADLPGGDDPSAGLQFRLAVKAWGRRAGACRVFARSQEPPPPPEPSPPLPIGARFRSIRLPNPPPCSASPHFPQPIFSCRTTPLPVLEGAAAGSGPRRSRSQSHALPFRIRNGGVGER